IILQRVNTHVSKSDPLELVTALRESFRGLEGLPLKSVKAQGCLRGSGLLNLVSSLVSGTVNAPWLRADSRLPANAQRSPSVRFQPEAIRLATDAVLL